MKKAETKIQDQIIAYLNKRHILHWRMQAVSNLFGFPDLLICYRGRFIAVELKTDVGKASETQNMTMQNIKTAGGLAIIVTSLQEMKEYLDATDSVIDGNIFK